MRRIIGKYEGEKRGPMLIVFGAMHGNENAGYKALELMIKMLDVEPVTNPHFYYNGIVLGLAGNLRAMKQKKRFINKDLNRCWTKENVEFAENHDKSELNEELLEIKESLSVIRKEIKRYKPERLYVLDLHTTSSNRGIFTIVPNNQNSIEIAVELGAPVITNLTNGLSGTSMQYFNTENMGVDTIALTFESGQHDDPLSINRAIAAITNCMKIIGSIDGRHIENRHNFLLVEYSKGLPKLCSLIMKHQIKPGDDFEMIPGFHNFQPVRKGDRLATDKNGPIYAASDGLMLMPLYQKQGAEGFFLIKVLDHDFKQTK
jgi:succinylglutamate desuccinylase